MLPNLEQVLYLRKCNYCNHMTMVWYVCRNKYFVLRDLLISLFSGLEDMLHILTYCKKCQYGLYDTNK